jgi:hypothetical protein
VKLCKTHQVPTVMLMFCIDGRGLGLEYHIEHSSNSFANHTLRVLLGKEMMDHLLRACLCDHMNKAAPSKLSLEFAVTSELPVQYSN